MKWNRFTIKTKTDAEDMIICTLAEIGVEGAEIQDHQPLTEEDKAQMFVDIMPEGPEDDGVAYLNFYLEEDADKDVILRDVRNALEELRTFMDIGEGTIEESQTEDKDWINNWKEFFHQFYVDDILIVPSWEEVKEEDKEALKKQEETLTETFKKALGDDKLQVKVEKLKDAEISSMITLSEETRRMQDMMKMYNMGMDASMFGGSGQVLVLNANNKLVQYVLEHTDSENTPKICEQLYDLAQLSHGSLTPERMTKFIARSNEIMGMMLN